MEVKILWLRIMKKGGVKLQLPVSKSGFRHRIKDNATQRSIDAVDIKVGQPILDIDWVNSVWGERHKRLHEQAEQEKQDGVPAIDTQTSDVKTVENTQVAENIANIVNNLYAARNRKATHAEVRMPCAEKAVSTCIPVSKVIVVPHTIIHALEDLCNLYENVLDTINKVYEMLVSSALCSMQDYRLRRTAFKQFLGILEAVYDELLTITEHFLTKQWVLRTLTSTTADIEGDIIDLAEIYKTYYETLVVFLFLFTTRCWGAVFIDTSETVEHASITIDTSVRVNVTCASMSRELCFFTSVKYFELPVLQAYCLEYKKLRDFVIKATREFGADYFNAILVKAGDEAWHSSIRSRYKDKWLNGCIDLPDFTSRVHIDMICCLCVMESAYYSDRTLGKEVDPRIAVYVDDVRKYFLSMRNTADNIEGDKTVEVTVAEPVNSISKSVGSTSKIANNVSKLVDGASKQLNNTSKSVNKLVEAQESPKLDLDQVNQVLGERHRRRKEQAAKKAQNTNTPVTEDLGSRGVSAPCSSKRSVEDEGVGVIYILTNPSFPQYVKIGYADDLQKRLQQLNRSSSVPFAFRVYATYAVDNRLQDLQVHNIIDNLNPNLRAIDNFKDKQRVREFYEMAPEAAYSLLESIAKISGSTHRLHRLCDDVDDETSEVVPADESEKRSKIAKAFSFDMVNIPVGATVQFIKDITVSAVVADEKHVVYGGRTWSLSSLATYLLGTTSSVQGTKYFMYKGEILTDLRERLGV